MIAEHKINYTVLFELYFARTDTQPFFVFHTPHIRDTFNAYLSMQNVLNMLEYNKIPLIPRLAINFYRTETCILLDLLKHVEYLEEWYPEYGKDIFKSYSERLSMMGMKFDFNSVSVIGFCPSSIKSIQKLSHDSVIRLYLKEEQVTFDFYRLYDWDTINDSTMFPPPIIEESQLPHSLTEFTFQQAMTINDDIYFIDVEGEHKDLRETSALYIAFRTNDGKYLVMI